MNKNEIIFESERTQSNNILSTFFWGLFALIISFLLKKYFDGFFPAFVGIFIFLIYKIFNFNKYRIVYFIKIDVLNNILIVSSATSSTSTCYESTTFQKFTFYEYYEKNIFVTRKSLLLKFDNTVHQIRSDYFNQTDFEEIRRLLREYCIYRVEKEW